MTLARQSLRTPHSDWEQGFRTLCFPAFSIRTLRHVCNRSAGIHSRPAARCKNSTKRWEEQSVVNQARLAVMNNCLKHLVRSGPDSGKNALCVNTGHWLLDLSVMLDNFCSVMDGITQLQYYNIIIIFAQIIVQLFILQEYMYLFIYWWQCLLVPTDGNCFGNFRRYIMATVFLFVRV